MTIYKIGAELKAKEDFKIEGFSGSEIEVKAEDKSFIDSSGKIHWITGKARGKIQTLKDVEVKGYDTENITSMIFKALSSEFGLKDILRECDFEEEDFKETIESVLSEIL